MRVASTSGQGRLPLSKSQKRGAGIPGNRTVIGATRAIWSVIPANGSAVGMLWLTKSKEVQSTAPFSLGSTFTVTTFVSPNCIWMS